MSNDSTQGTGPQLRRRQLAASRSLGDVFFWEKLWKMWWFYEFFGNIPCFLWKFRIELSRNWFVKNFCKGTAKYHIEITRALGRSVYLWVSSDWWKRINPLLAFPFPPGRFCPLDVGFQWPGTILPLFSNINWWNNKGFIMASTASQVYDLLATGVWRES